jgi:hypothetical protein
MCSAIKNHSVWEICRPRPITPRSTGSRSQFSPNLECFHDHFSIEHIVFEVLLLPHNGVTPAHRVHARDGFAFMPADVGRLRSA